MKINSVIAKKLLKFVLPYRNAALLSTMFVSLTVILNMVPPLLYRLIIDEGIKEGNAHQMEVYAGFIILTVTGSAIMQLVEEYFSCQFGLVMMNDVRNRLYCHLQALPIDFFHRTSTGAIIGRFTSDLLNVQKVVARTLPSVITNILMIVFSITTMLYLSWQLTLVTIIAIPLYAIFALKVSKIVAAISARAMTYGDSMMTRLGEDFAVDGLIFFKLFGIQDTRRKAFASLTGEIQDIRLKLSLWGRTNNIAIDLMQSLGMVAIYYIGGLILLEKSITFGTIIAFAAIAGRLYQPIAFFSSSITDLPTAILSMDRINSFFEETQQPLFEMRVLPVSHVHEALVPAQHVNCSVVFDNISFQYPGANQGGGIHKFTLSVKKGERVAIVGANGSGKTTLLMLLAGIYQPDTGEIYISGRKISALKQFDISQLLGIGLGQGFFLNSTIGDNLRTVKPSASDAELQDVLMRANCDDFILTLPEGINTRLGQGGLKLSSGQRQRLSLARLFLKGADVLCFDETTANIDSGSEDLIVDTINSMLPTQTTIFISHSLKTVKQMARILVIEKGRLVGDGPHADLILNCPEYRKLFGIEWELIKRLGEVT
jgi:ATP-binding cassette subfamily B protein